jgi:hypothetical protein
MTRSEIRRELEEGTQAGAVKPILGYEAQTMRDAQLGLTAPLNYGAMPSLGL